MRPILMALTLVGCGGSTSSLAALCKANCDKSASCAPPADPQCEMRCRQSFYSAYNDDVQRGFKTCVEQSDCAGTGLEDCTKQVVNEQPRRAVDDAYDRACLTKLNQCPGATFECGKLTNPYSESFVTDRLQPCLDVPCDQVKTCEDNLFP